MHEARESTPIASIEKVRAEPGVSARANGVVLEARLVWGRDTLGVSHVAPRAGLRIRDLGLDVPGSADLVVGTVDEAGSFGLCLPNGAAVPEDCRMNLRMGRTTLRLTLVPDDAVQLPRARPDPRTALGILGAAALHLLVLGFVAHARIEETTAAEPTHGAMQRMMVSAEERALAELAAATAPPTPAPTPAEHEAEAELPGMATNAQVAAGPRATTMRPGPERVTKAPEARSTRPADEVASFGILSILGGDAARTRAGRSAFAAEGGRSALGNIFDQTIDDVAGSGGLGLSGVGEGGGGKGAGVPLAPLGSTGTLGWASGESPLGAPGAPVVVRRTSS